jgi:hypothetical protein
MKLETIFVEGLNRYINFYIGKDQYENFKVIDKGNDKDLWFHAKGVSSCHVVSIIPDDITDKKKLKTLKIIIKKGFQTDKGKASKYIDENILENLLISSGVNKLDVSGKLIGKFLKLFADFC